MGLASPSSDENAVTILSREALVMTTISAGPWQTGTTGVPVHDRIAIAVGQRQGQAPFAQEQGVVEGLIECGQESAPYGGFCNGDSARRR